MHTIDKTTGVLDVRLGGHVTTDDYEAVIPLVESSIEANEEVRLIWDMRELEAVEPLTIWSDVVFDMRHRTKFERIAIVGDLTWQPWAARLFRVLTDASVRRFGADERNLAESWVRTLREPLAH